MNANNIKNKDREGSALLITIMLASVVALMVAGAVRLVSHEYSYSVHSSNWSQCLHSAEAGVEIGLAALQQTIDTEYAWSAYGWVGSATNWTKTTTDLAPVGHSYPDSDYTVSVDSSDPSAYTVTATATMPEPRTGSNITRTVKVTLEPQWFRRFERGMLGRDLVDFQGNPVCDSYDSTAGPYGGGNVSTNCPVASMMIGAGGVSGGGSPTIYGDVYVTEGGDAQGDFWTGQEYQDLDVDIPSYVPDQTHMTDPGMTGGETITVSGMNDYVGVPFIAPQGANKWINIEGEGKVTIYVAGETDFGTASDLNIIPDPGKTLEVVIVSNGDLNLKGTLNKDQDPLNLQIYGTENCANMDVEANNEKALCVYAPDTYVKLSGTAEIMGSIVGKELDVQGNFDFHFDESLANREAPILVGWDIAKWEEL